MGAVKWRIRPNASPTSEIWSSAAWVGNDVVIGVGSDEELSSNDPRFSGSVVRIAPDTGDVVWQTFTISTAEITQGSSGAGIWSTPSYDPATGLISVSTGNSYTNPASASSDAVLALDAATGAVKWRYQPTPGDAGQIDADFGDSAHVYSLGNTHVIGIGLSTPAAYRSAHGNKVRWFGYILGQGHAFR